MGTVGTRTTPAQLPGGPAPAPTSAPQGGVPVGVHRHRPSGPLAQPSGRVRPASGRAGRNFPASGVLREAPGARGTGPLPRSQPPRAPVLLRGLPPRPLFFCLLFFCTPPARFMGRFLCQWCNVRGVGPGARLLPRSSPPRPAPSPLGFPRTVFGSGQTHVRVDLDLLPRSGHRCSVAKLYDRSQVPTTDGPHRHHHLPARPCSAGLPPGPFFGSGQTHVRGGRRPLASAGPLRRLGPTRGDPAASTAGSGGG